MNKKVAVGLSGGVDSSLAAYFLKKAGWNVSGFTLKLDSDYDPATVTAARRVCESLGIPHRTIDARSLFKKEIIDYFISTYLKGLTPNPCVFCNRRIKFGFLLDAVRASGIDYLATGHYARLSSSRRGIFIREGKDRLKSQEYFLALVKPDILKHLIFPLGNYTKVQVKKIAAARKMVFKTRESQDICFVRGRYYPKFIEAGIRDSREYAGNIRHISGKILGRHRGIYHYTYGQRAGLGISWPKPLYVVSINGAAREVVVGEKTCLYRKNFFVRSPNWFLNPQKIRKLKVRLRYNSPLYDCNLKMAENCLQVFLNKPVAAVTPGQVAAFYYKKFLLGGGIIAGE